MPRVILEKTDIFVQKPKILMNSLTEKAKMFVWADRTTLFGHLNKSGNMKWKGKKKSDWEIGVNTLLSNQNTQLK